MNDIQQVKSNRYLMKLTLPVFIEMLFGLLMGNVDQLMINTQSRNAYTAIGNTNQIINLFIIFFSVVAMASTIMISQYIGSKNHKKIEQLYSLSMAVNLIIGVVVSLFLLLFNAQILKMLDYPQELMYNSRIFISIIGGGLFLNAIMVTYSSFLKSNGFMKECMYISVIINIINLVGNCLLIFGWFGLPKLGIVGSAVASNFSKLVGVLMFIYLYKKRIGVKISIKQIMPFPVAQLKKMMGIGLPSGGESLAYSFAIIVIQKTINKFGTEVVSARVTVNMISFVSWIFALAISSTTQIIVGYLMGARDIEGTEERFKSSRKLSMLCSLIGSLILFFLCKPICGIFVHETAILNLCQQIMFVEIFLEQGRAVNLVTVRSLQACGDTKFPIFLGIIDEWVVAVGLGYVLAVVFNMGLVGVWIAMASDEIIRAIIFTIRWEKGKWRSMVLAD